VEEHNSKISTKMTLLRNLKFTRNWNSSKIFSGMIIPTASINRLIEKYQTQEDYQIFRMLMGWAIEL